MSPWKLRPPYALLALSATLSLGTASPAAPYPEIKDIKFSHRGPVATDFTTAFSRLKPYTGITRAGADPSTLDGKLMVGYQGWFGHPDDGSNDGYNHYAYRNQFQPGICTMDMWPDLSEMDPDEKYPTSFVHKDGSPAWVFSSYNPKTVARHFRWMADYNIDGAFIQRFGVGLKKPDEYDFRTGVLENARFAAHQFGRTWAIMYDLSGLKPGELDKYILGDWKQLVARTQLKQDTLYQRHNGKPLVAIWGIGFDDTDKSRPSAEECLKLIQFLKNDPVYGGNAIMIGVPFAWRTPGQRDASSDPNWNRIYMMADVISPWSIGRYNSIADYDSNHHRHQVPDLKLTQKRGQSYMPVIFPGFSWQNLEKIHGRTAPQPAIPRLGGQFFSHQADQLINSGSRMIYVAMFDEIDEATAIFKVTDDPPVGASSFLGMEGQPSDTYLRLCSEISQRLKTLPPPAAPAPAN